jgi:uncharacterized membrane protein
MNLSFKLPKTLKKILAVLVIGVVFLFFLKILQQNWLEISDKLIRPKISWLFFGFCGFSGYYFLRIYAWRKLLKLAGYFLNFKQAGEVLMLSEFARYVPGNIWSVVGRVSQSEKYGIPKTQTLYATIIEILTLLAASVLIGGLAGLFVKDFAVWLKLLAGLGAISVTVIFWFSKLLKLIIKWLLAKFKIQVDLEVYSLGQIYALLFVFVLAWLAYVLGGLALSLAFFDLNLNQTFLILAAMPLGWFLGYISFLTPSGLGVREASVAAILKNTLGSSSVLIAAFTRFGVTLVEFFWVLVFAWRYLKQFLLQIWRFLRQPKGLVIVVSAAFGLYFSAISVLMHSKVITGRFDLGNMDQVVWNTSQGRIFQFTNPYGEEIASRYIHHADVILLLFAPIYWLYASPYVLLVAQALIVAFGGWLVYRLAKKILGHEWLAAFLALSYLFYPTLQRAVMFDFHGITLGATFSVGMVLAYTEKRWRAFWIYAALLAMCKEELVLMVATFGLFILWRERKEWRKAILATIFGLAYFAMNFLWLMPAARDWQPSKYNFQYETLGSKPSEILKTLSENPKLFLSMVAGNQARHLYAGLLGPVGFLPLASPLWLAVAWPDFAVNLFNDRIEPRLLNYHYQGTITGFVFVATIFGIAAVRKRAGPFWERNIRNRLKFKFETVIIVLILATTAIESYRLSPLPYSQRKDMRVYWRAPMAPIVRQAVAKIPTEAKVSATNTVGAQLAHRQYLFQFPLGIEKSDYILILMAKAGTLEWQRNHLAAEALAKDQRFKLIGQKDNFYFYQRVW